MPFMQKAKSLLGKRKNWIEIFNDLIRDNDNFQTVFSEYLAFEGDLIKYKTFTPEELDAWIEILTVILRLAENDRINDDESGKLRKHVVSCSIRALQYNEQKVRELVKKLCRVLVDNRFTRDLLAFTQNKLQQRSPELACIIYSEVAPGSLTAVNFYKNLWASHNGKRIVKDYALNGIEKNLSYSITEPGFSKNNNLLEWITEVFPHDSIVKKASDLILGLWQGKYTVQDIDYLENEFFSDFSNRGEQLYRDLAFAVACIILKAEYMTQYIHLVSEHEPKWAGEYVKIVRAFILSLKGEYPEIKKQRIVQPKPQDFPLPLYSFILLAYITYAKQYIHSFNAQQLYDQLSGPWRDWCDQFSHREVPYQLNPNLEKYEKLIYSELVADDIKEQVAPWVVEFAFFREGVQKAQAKIDDMPNSLQPGARKRLNALKGVLPESDAAVIEKENDLLCLVRHSIMTHNSKLLESTFSHPLFNNLHNNEKKLGTIAQICFNGSKLSSSDITSAVSIAERGVPTGLYLVSLQLYKDRNFQQAATFLETCCSIAPAILKWQEYLAQCCASVNDISRACEILEKIEEELSQEGKTLYAWCLFLSIFPTDISLVNCALSSGKGLGDGQRNMLKRCILLLDDSDDSLKHLVSPIISAIDNIGLKPQKDMFPSYGLEWFTIQSAITAEDPTLFFDLIQEIENWNKSYSREVIQWLAYRFLSRLDLNEKKTQEHIHKLLEILGKTKEEFYYEQLIHDISTGVDLDTLYNRYAEIYDASHSVFSLVILYRAFEKEEFDKVLEILQGHPQSASSGSLTLCRIYILARQEQWDALISAILEYSESDSNNHIIRKLLNFAFQISLVQGKDDVKQLLIQLADKGININEIPSSFRSYLMKNALSVVNKNSDPELIQLLENALDPSFSAFIKLITADLSTLVTLLPKQKAHGNWGAFIYKKAIALLLKDIKKISSFEKIRLVRETMPILHEFIIKNEIDTIDQKEVEIINTLAVIVANNHKCEEVLCEILQIDNATELIMISNGLLNALDYPADINEFERKVKDLLQAKGYILLDHLWLLIGVINCWLEYIEQQKTIPKIHSKLLAWITAFRTAMYTHNDFVKWVTDKRSSLPPEEQYREEVGEFLEYQLYEWFTGNYTSAMDNLFIQNSFPIAKNYADCLQSLTKKITKSCEGFGIDSVDLNNERIDIVKGVAKDRLEKWIKDKKGNLEMQMYKNEETDQRLQLEYEKGIKIILNILQVVPKNKDLLRLGLHYANEWNKDIQESVDDDIKDIYPKSKAAKEIKNTINNYSNLFADNLMSLCKKGKKYEGRIENQELSKHFYFKALVENQENPFTLIEQILSWDSNHDKIIYFYLGKYFYRYEQGEDAYKIKRLLGRLRDLVDENSQMYHIITQKMS